MKRVLKEVASEPVDSFIVYRPCWTLSIGAGNVEGCVGVHDASPRNFNVKFLAPGDLRSYGASPSLKCHIDVTKPSWTLFVSRYSSIYYRMFTHSDNYAEKVNKLEHCPQPFNRVHKLHAATGVRWNPLNRNLK
jgi:hypothetical protein